MRVVVVRRCAVRRQQYTASRVRCILSSGRENGVASADKSEFSCQNATPRVSMNVSESLRLFAGFVPAWKYASRWGQSIGGKTPACPPMTVKRIPIAIGSHSSGWSAESRRDKTTGHMAAPGGP